MFPNDYTIIQIKPKPGAQSTSHAGTTRQSESPSNRNSLQNPSVRFNADLHLGFGCFWPEEQLPITGNIEVVAQDPTRFALFAGDSEIAHLDRISLTFNRSVITPLSDEEIVRAGLGR